MKCYYISLEHNASEKQFRRIAYCICEENHQGKVSYRLFPKKNLIVQNIIDYRIYHKKDCVRYNFHQAPAQIMPRIKLVDQSNKR